MVMTQLAIESEKKERTIISESRAWAMRKRQRWAAPFRSLRIFPEKPIQGGLNNMILPLSTTPIQNSYEIKIKGSYIKLRSLYVGVDAMRNLSLSAGQTLVSIQGNDDFLAEGTLNAAGYLSGMTKLYRVLDLGEGDTVYFSISDTGNIMIILVTKAVSIQPELTPEILPQIPTTKTIFERNDCKHIHFEAFRPQNLDVWKPETEVDVFLAFGVLQEFTDYIYCCGASLSLLQKIGLDYTETSKPDAILIDRRTDQYVIAEWKKFSSDYKKNHKRDDADIVVCWEHNETDDARLPLRGVLELRSIAKEAAIKIFREKQEE